MRIGVTGHRADRLGPRATACLRASTGPLLATLDAACLSGASPAEPGGPNTLVTCAADGADSLFADAAIAAGWRLELVLPFPRSEFRHDFDDMALADLDRQLAVAARVIALTGRRDDPAGRAYADAGATMLSRCDLLIGAWDGGPGRGPGGTVDVIAAAVARRIPVLVVDPLGERRAEAVCPSPVPDARADAVRMAGVVAAMLGGRPSAASSGGAAG